MLLLPYIASANPGRHETTINEWQLWVLIIKITRDFNFLKDEKGNLFQGMNKLLHFDEWFILYWSDYVYIKNGKIVNHCACGSSILR